jgi:hypothetical protein
MPTPNTEARPPDKTALLLLLLLLPAATPPLLLPLPMIPLARPKPT